MKIAIKTSLLLLLISGITFAETSETEALKSNCRDELCDSNWETYVIPNKTYTFIYTRPENSSNEAIWRVKDQKYDLDTGTLYADPTISELNLAEYGCLSSKKIKLRLRVYSNRGGSRIYWECRAFGSWETLRSESKGFPDGGAVAYEEALIWSHEPPIPAEEPEDDFEEEARFSNCSDEICDSDWDTYSVPIPNKTYNFTYIKPRNFTGDIVWVVKDQKYFHGEGTLIDEPTVSEFSLGEHGCLYSKKIKLRLRNFYMSGRSKIYWECRTMGGWVTLREEAYISFSGGAVAYEEKLIFNVD